MQNPKTKILEMPQKGNPHRLTINQHIFPRASMNRFVNERSGVQVRRLGQAGCVEFGTKNPYFCASRVWDQKVEHGLMVDIENRFQDVAEKIVDQSVRTLTDAMNQAVTDLYLLWNLRFNRNANPMQDVSIIGVLPERDLGKDSQEILESKGVVFIKPDGTLPGRMMAGISITIGIDRERLRMRGTSWGILTAECGEFVVPDNFSKYSVLPLTPTICLAAGLNNQRVDLKLVAKINALAIQGSERYYFAKDFTQCPVRKWMPLQLEECIRLGDFNLNRERF